MHLFSHLVIYHVLLILLKHSIFKKLKSITFSKYFVFLPYPFYFNNCYYYISLFLLSYYLTGYWSGSNEKNENDKVD